MAHLMNQADSPPMAHSLRHKKDACRWLWCMAALYISLCIGGVIPLAHAAQESGAAAIERDVKAAFLYKFLGYIEWPPASFSRADSPFVIGVIDADDIAEELSRVIAGRSVNNRAVTVRRLTSAEQITGIHLLFIGRTESAREPQLLRIAQKQPILTVTETDGALAIGSVINFRLIDGRVRFEVSLAAAERNELKLSSRLLSVAVSVQGGAR
jgi:hypothetical protein